MSMNFKSTGMNLRSGATTSRTVHFDSEDCPNPRPPENHLSLASLTRWAITALFVNWNPWTGVTVSEVAVPEVC